MSNSRNEFLDHRSEESDSDDGYDSEAAEVSKGGRSTATTRGSVKRRKLSHSEDGDEVAEIGKSDSRFDVDAFSDSEGDHLQIEAASDDEGDEEEKEDAQAESLRTQQRENKPESKAKPSQSTSKPDAQAKSKSKPKSKPGVIYLSSLPPYLKPSALRNLLIQRGFEPINRLFLTPASKSKSTSKKNSRQTYSEGWVEFTSKSTAKRCAESLNAQTIGGKKGGFYHDDIWNMKYLRGMGWDELMAGIREERREEEGRRDEERRIIAKETKRFVEGVEEGRRVEGIKNKRKRSGKGDKTGDEGTDANIKRTWRQYEVKGKDRPAETTSKSDKMTDDAKAVLAKIF